MTVLGRTTSRSHANNIFGMFVVAVGTGLFCAAGAIGQFNGGSILQMRLGSFGIQNMICWAWWWFRKPSQSVNWFGDSPNKFNIWVRGVLFWILIFSWYKGLEMVPIGDAEALIFLSPILTVFVGRIYLKESLPRSYPITLILTIGSLILICQPEFIFGIEDDSDDYTQVNWPGLVFVLITVCCWTAVSILTRTGKEAHWVQVNLVTSFECAWIWTPFAAILNHFIGNNLGNGNGNPVINSDYSKVAWIDGYDFSDWNWDTFTIITICAVAFFEFFAILCKVVGYQLGDSTKVASMEYFDIFFAFAFQYWMFDRTPNKWELIGGAILVLSCIGQIVEEKYFAPPELSTNDIEQSDNMINGIIDNEIGEKSALLNDINKDKDNTVTSTTTNLNGITNKTVDMTRRRNNVNSDQIIDIAASNILSK